VTGAVSPDVGTALCHCRRALPQSPSVPLRTRRRSPPIVHRGSCAARPYRSRCRPPADGVAAGAAGNTSSRTTLASLRLRSRKEPAQPLHISNSAAAAATSDKDDHAADTLWLRRRRAQPLRRSPWPYLAAAISGPPSAPAGAAPPPGFWRQRRQPPATATVNAAAAAETEKPARRSLPYDGGGERSRCGRRRCILPQPPRFSSVAASVTLSVTLRTQIRSQPIPRRGCSAARPYLCRLRPPANGAAAGTAADRNSHAAFASF